MPALMVSLPTAADVEHFLGAENGSLPGAEEAVRMTIALASAMTRGQGFDPPNHKVAEDLHAVIVMAAARLTGNPEQDRRVQFGDYSVTPTTSWSLVEQAVLNRYRRRAQ